MVGDGQDYTHKNPAIKRSVYVLKTDASGNEEWRLTFGTVGWNYGKFGIQLDDDSFVVSGAFTALVGAEQVQRRAAFLVDNRPRSKNTAAFSKTRLAILK